MSKFTCDDFYQGRVKVLQPQNGFRAGTDSLLLASAIDAHMSGKALELGTGAGGALLPAAFRCQELNFKGLEIDPQMVELVSRGIDKNGVQARVSVDQGSVQTLSRDWQNEFDLVFSNPPFFEAGSIPAPGEGKGDAYLESVPLRAWINAMLFALRPKGVFLMVHRAADLARILAILERQTGEIAVLPIHSYPGADAKRVLMRARKALRSGPMRLLEARYLYKEKGGERTDWAVAMQRDGAGIDWN